jgi:hypothetical protein
MTVALAYLPPVSNVLIIEFVMGVEMGMVGWYAKESDLERSGSHTCTATNDAGLCHEHTCAADHPIICNISIAF